MGTWGPDLLKGGGGGVEAYLHELPGPVWAPFLLMPGISGNNAGLCLLTKSVPFLQHLLTTSSGNFTGILAGIDFKQKISRQEA